MRNINVICVDSLKEDFNRAAQSEYLKRLSVFCKAQVIEMSPARVRGEESESEKTIAMKEEGALILKHLSKGYNIAMCVEGKELSSINFADLFEKVSLGGESKINFIIGGAFGLSDEVKEKCDLKLSLSQMTMPHELARIFLLEQIYRAFSIIKGTKYHK